jgi:predicted Rossmann-fold nucleotide-binding protein
LFEILTLVQTGKTAPLPVVLVGREFWNRAINFDFLVTEGMIDRQDFELFTFAESADEILGTIAAWHAARGTPLVSS